jgi:hypothetical protein
MSAQRATKPAQLIPPAPRRASAASHPRHSLPRKRGEASESRRGPSTLSSDRGRGADISCVGQSGPSSHARHCATSCTVSKQPEAEQSGGKAPRADLPTDLTSNPMSAPPSAASKARLRSRLCPRSAPRSQQAPPARAERASAASHPRPPRTRARSWRASSEANEHPRHSLPRKRSEASESRRGPSTLASDRGRGADISCAGPSGPSHQARQRATGGSVSKQPEAEQSGGKAPRADLPTDLTIHPMSALPSAVSKARLRSRLCPRSAPRSSPSTTGPRRDERAQRATRAASAHEQPRIVRANVQVEVVAMAGVVVGREYGREQPAPGERARQR